MKLFIILLIFFSSCSTLEDGDEVLYLDTGNAYLPIYVRGNKNSDTYILWTHGGPGSSGLYYGDMEEIRQLHENNRVIYWDQLSAGGSIGNPTPEDLTADTYASHMQGVINIIKKRYNPKNLFLLGHSWGGFLSAYYLIANGDKDLAQKRQSQVNGFIAMNGVFDVPDVLTNGVIYMTNYAAEQIIAGNNVSRWEKIFKFYSDREFILNGDDFTPHLNFVNEANGIVVNRARFEKLLSELAIKYVIDSPFNFYSYFDNQASTRRYLEIGSESVADDRHPSLDQINIPTLMLAGARDRVAFPHSVQRWYQILTKGGKDPKKFQLKLYRNSAHSIFLDQPQDFRRDVETFINENRKL